MIGLETTDDVHLNKNVKSSSHILFNHMHPTNLATKWRNFLHMTIIKNKNNLDKREHTGCMW